MGASPYFYYVPYQSDIQAALNKLREREFQAGRYNPVIDFPEFPVTDRSPAPGAEHDSIEEALEDADADGTRSILDLDHVSDGPYDPEGDDFCGAAPLADEQLTELFGTTQPTHEQVEAHVWDMADDIARGTGIYIVVYAGGEPSELFFAGYSFD